MTLRGTFSTTILFLGDSLVFALSLWLMLFIRYAGSFEGAYLREHFYAFTPLFVVWLLIFYMAGLYGKRIVLFKSSVFRAIVQTQFFNIVLAALYFFIVPVGIAPKTNLVLYLLISLVLILSWRFLLFPQISRPARRESALIIGSGAEVVELQTEVNANDRYYLRFVEVLSFADVPSTTEVFVERIRKESITTLVVSRNQLPSATVLALQSAIPTLHILDFEEVYEEVFDRIPLSLLGQEWFVQYALIDSPLFYSIVKRVIDIVGALAMGVILLLLTPFIALAMRLEGAGPVFITQERLGKGGVFIRSYKFRSMRFSDGGKWKGEGENYVTKVGAFLRLTSLDEFPQCLNILRGELSLIGPRNDIRALGERLSDALAYYQMRYTVTPGITGWAQINQQYEQGNISPQSVEETKVRLAYDFYYIKNRSLALDIVIALKTVKRMLFRVSSW